MRFAIVIPVAAGLVVFIACETAILSDFYDKGDRNLDYIIVLGAQMRENTPSVIYRYRLETAKEYLEANPHTICVVTGGKGSNESVSEGKGGADWLVKNRISAKRLVIEDSSTDTVQNLQNALKLINAEKEAGKDLRIGVVSNGFHVFRGTHIAKKLTKAGIYGIAASSDPLYLPNNMVRECIGILRDFLRGKLAF